MPLKPRLQVMSTVGVPGAFTIKTLRQLMSYKSSWGSALRLSWDPDEFTIKEAS
jgi:hypothetical protein